MPITQDRMIAMASAARDLYTVWKGMKEGISSSTRDGLSGKITPQEALQEIESVLDSWQPNLDSVILMAAEEQHFKDTAASNILSRRRQAKRRGKNPDDPIPLNVTKPKDAAAFIKSQEFVPDHSQIPPHIRAEIERAADLIVDGSKPKPGYEPGGVKWKEGNIEHEAIFEEQPAPDPDAPLGEIKK